MLPHQKQQPAMPNSNIIIIVMLQVMTSHSARLPAITKDIPGCHVIRYNKLINCNELLLPWKIRLARKSHGSRHCKVSFPVSVRDSKLTTSLHLYISSVYVAEECDLGWVALSVTGGKSTGRILWNAYSCSASFEISASFNQSLKCSLPCSQESNMPPF